MLGNYKVSSTAVRVGDLPRKGYRREDLHDAWLRYLPPGSREGSQGSHARSAAHSGVTDVTLQAVTEKALHSGGAKTQRTVTDLPCKACDPELSVEEAAVSVLCCSCLTRARRAGLG